MEREHWAELSQCISEVAARWKNSPRDTHPTATIVRVQLWAVAHNASTHWATDPRNWDAKTPPACLPDQSTMSRRMARQDFWAFFEALGKRLAGKPSGALLKCLDGKPLPVAAHCRDPQATWGYGAGQKLKGYKLHAIWSDSPMPEAWTVAPLDVSEKKMARRLIGRLGGGG